MMWFCYRRSHHPLGSVAPPVRSRPPSLISTRAVVVQSLDEMRFDAVQALWLVDICDLSYQDAAAAARTSVTVFAERLHDARRELRQNYASAFNV